VFSNVKNFFSNIFFKEAPELDTDMIENKALTEITSILNLAWEGKRLSDDEKNIVSLPYNQLNLILLLSI